MCCRWILTITTIISIANLVYGDILFFNNDGLRCEDAQDEFNVLDRSKLKRDEAAPGTEKVDASSCKIYRIEPTAFEGLGELRILNLSNNLLSQLGSEELQNLANVEVVDLTKNALRSLHPDTFLKNTKMAYLNLSDNVLFLNDFTKALVAPGVNFNLFFDNNRPDIFSTTIKSDDGSVDGSDTIFHRVVASHMFGSDRQILGLEEHLKHLIHPNTFRLSLINNNLQVLHPDTFYKCRKLFYLKLSDNKIEILHSDMFSKNTILRIVHLRNNRILTLPENIFKTPTRLTVIDLRNNLLRSLPAKVFKPLVDLQILRLANNELSSIPANVFSSNKNLVTLEMGGNKLKYLDASFLSSNPLIKGLDLSRNELKEISYSLVEKMDKLKTLRLDNNFFTDLSPRFYQMDTLDELTIFCNNLTQFPMSIKEVKAKNLFLHGNPWKCGCLSYIISLGVNYKVPNADKRVPLICILGRDQDVCDQRSVSPEELNEWSVSRSKFKDVCKPILDTILDIR